MKQQSDQMTMVAQILSEELGNSEIKNASSRVLFFSRLWGMYLFFLQFFGAQGKHAELNGQTIESVFSKILEPIKNELTANKYSLLQCLSAQFSLLSCFTRDIKEVIETKKAKAAEHEKLKRKLQSMIEGGEERGKIDRCASIVSLVSASFLQDAREIQ